MPVEVFSRNLQMLFKLLHLIAHVFFPRLISNLFVPSIAMHKHMHTREDEELT